MSKRKEVVERYVQAFRDSDHDAVLAVLHDDVVLTLHGSRTLVGKDNFDTEIENPSTPGKPQLTLEKLIEDGDTVVAQGRGDVSLRDGGALSFVFCDVFVFEGELIKKLESYQVNLNQASAVG